MIITRNGIDIELTEEEMRRAYEIKDREYMIEDIESKLEEAEVWLSDELIESIADIAKSTLEHHDSYWECYWMAIEYAIEHCNDELIL